MVSSNKYEVLWQKYKAAITNTMKNAIITPQEYVMSKHEFETIGGRLNSGYTFNLELNSGRLGIISNSVVARDLFEVLKKSDTARKIMEGHHFKISMSNKFILKVITV